MEKITITDGGPIIRFSVKEIVKIKTPEARGKSQGIRYLILADHKDRPDEIQANFTVSPQQLAAGIEVGALICLRVHSKERLRFLGVAQCGQEGNDGNAP